MSRIGSRPIKIEDGVTLDITPGFVIVKKDQSEMKMELSNGITIKQLEGEVVVERKNSDKVSRSRHGLIARLLKNMIIGVSQGFTRELEFKGTGYRASVDGNTLLLNMGYSHEIKLEIPEGVTVAVKKNTFQISGIDKSSVGEFAAKIRKVRMPEVYKGKGIRYKEEIIKRKAGKKAASA